MKLTSLPLGTFENISLWERQEDLQYKKILNAEVFSDVLTTWQISARGMESLQFWKIPESKKLLMYVLRVWGGLPW